jgi:acetoacetyl-CoA synthetase
VWRHGDWVTITDRGSLTITGRSDATLNRGGVRIGTAEIYRVTEAIEGVVDSLVVHLEAGDASDLGTLVLFVVLADGLELDDAFVERVRGALRNGLSPRHVPDRILQLDAIPTTLSGKKLELPVKKILLGADPGAVASRGALRDPAALDQVVDVAVTLRTQTKR